MKFVQKNQQLRKLGYPGWHTLLADYDNPVFKVMPQAEYHTIVDEGTVKSGLYPPCPRKRTSPYFQTHAGTTWNVWFDMPHVVKTSLLKQIEISIRLASTSPEDYSIYPPETIRAVWRSPDIPYDDIRARIFRHKVELHSWIGSTLSDRDRKISDLLIHGHLTHGLVTVSSVPHAQIIQDIDQYVSDAWAFDNDWKLGNGKSSYALHFKSAEDRSMAAMMI